MSLSSSAQTTYLITIPGNPHAKMRPRISAPVKGRRPRTHQDPKDKAAEDRTREILRASGCPCFTGNVALNISFYRASRQIVDVDNLQKHVLDAGLGVLYTDDCQITALTCSLDLDRDNPRTVIQITRDHASTLKRGTDHTA
jgi:Holliday junction resolvase RusA-like endonuclease